MTSVSAPILDILYARASPCSLYYSKANTDPYRVMTAKKHGPADWWRRIAVPYKYNRRSPRPADLLPSAVSCTSETESFQATDPFLSTRS